MKTLSIAPTHFRAWKVDTAARGDDTTTPPPRVSYENISPLMSGTAFPQPTSPQFSSCTTTPHQTSPLADATPRINTPSRIPSRRTSATPLRKISASFEQSSQNKSSPTHGDRTPDGDGREWSSIGRASLGGKTSRVVDSLMGRNTELTQRLNVANTSLMEVEKRESLSGTIIDQLRAETSNLQHSKDIDANIIKRRDRKIEELKEEIEREKARRLTAEQTASVATRERDEAIASRQHEVQEAREMARQSEATAKIYQENHRRHQEDFRQQQTWLDTQGQDMLDEVKRRHEENKSLKQRIDVINEQKQHEIDKATRTNEELKGKMETYGKDVLAYKIKLARHANKEADSSRRIIDQADEALNGYQQYARLMRLHDAARQRPGHTTAEDEATDDFTRADRTNTLLSNGPAQHHERG